MRTPHNLIGQRFTRLLVLERVGSTTRPNGLRRCPKWRCICDCGTIKIVATDSLTGLKAKSCGCYNRDQIRMRTLIHGYSGTALYRTWHDMKTRCYYKRSMKYPRYGGRGIQVCDEWKKDASAFVLWALSNGYVEGLQIDRVDNNGNYEPTNCRFVSGAINARNRPQCKDHPDFVSPPFRGNQYVRIEYKQASGYAEKL